MSTIKNKITYIEILFHILLIQVDIFTEINE